LAAILFHSLIVRDGILLRMAPWNIRARKKGLLTREGGNNGETTDEEL